MKRISILLLVATTLSAQPSPPGAVNGALAGKDIITVKDFGAKGNGVADDTAALQAAIAAAQAAKLSLFVPTGTYLFTGLTVTGGLDIYGPGAPLYSVLKYTGSGTALRFTNGAGRIRNLTITSSAPASIGIDFSRTSEMYLDHVEVGTNPTSKFGVGVRLAESGIVMLEHYVSSWNDIGVLLDKGLSANAHIVIQNGNFFQQSVAAIQIVQGIEVYIEKNWMEAFRTGILLDSSAGLVTADSIFIKNNSMFSGVNGALAAKVDGRQSPSGPFIYNFLFEGNTVLKGSGAYHIELRYANTVYAIGRFAFRNNLFRSFGTDTLAAVYGDSQSIQVFSENDLADPLYATFPIFSDGLAGTVLRSGSLQFGSSTPSGQCDASTRGTLAFDEGIGASGDSLKICIKNASGVYAWKALF